MFPLPWQDVSAREHSLAGPLDARSADVDVPVVEGVHERRPRRHERLRILLELVGGVRGERGRG